MSPKHPTRRADEGGFIPALRFHRLTPLFDFVAAVAVRDRAIKRRVLARAEIASGDELLDVGCGTGTLAVAAARAAPGVKVTGLDPDASILARARRRSAEAGLEIRFDEGTATALPYRDASFDLVLSTLMFHHLPDVQLLDGFATTALNVRGGLPDVLAGAGFREVSPRDRTRTPTGTYEIINMRCGEAELRAGAAARRG